jgi:hypothetical protein
VKGARTFESGPLKRVGIYAHPTENSERRLRYGHRRTNASRGRFLKREGVRNHRSIVRSELLDLVLVLGRGHLLRLLCDYEAHYNSHRPHRGIDLNAPERNDFSPRVVPLDEIERTAVVGGLISEYHVEAA